MPETNDRDNLLEQCGYVGEGEFQSPVPGYPGGFKLPHPFMGRHYKAWLRATREKKGDEIEDLTAFKEWRGFAVLIQDWTIDGVPRIDVTADGDNVPEQVKFWARTCLAAYLADLYDPKAWRGESETT